jgi:peptidyl-prolyl cis-trans isomerase C
MSRRLDVINLGDPQQAASPKMMSSCETSGCVGPEPAIPPPPTFGEVRVNGIEIDPEAIAREIQHHPAPDAETAWIEAARALVVRELLIQEARRQALPVEQQTDPDGRLETEDDALVRELLEQEVSPQAPDEAECRRYYDANVERFRTPELFEAAHILIEAGGEGQPALDEARRQAEALIVEISDDLPAFAAAARAHSSCSSAQQDGSLGQIRRGELVPEIQLALEGLDEGAIGSVPVRSRYGWHILRLHRRIPGRTLPFEMVKPKIAEMLEARSWSVEATRYVAHLGKAAVEGVSLEPVG